MKRILLLIVLLIIFFTNCNTFPVSGKTEKIRTLHYKIEDVPIEEKTTHMFNKFDPIHHFYIDIFLSLDLYDSFTYDQKKDIITKIINIISKNDMAALTVEKYKDNKDLKILLRPNHPPNFPGETVIWVISNFDKAKNKIVSGDDMNNAFSAIHFIKGDKLIKYRDLYSKNKEDSLINKGDMNNLAYYYIYDDNNENDAKAVEILLKTLEEVQKPGDRFLCMMTLSEYYFIRNNLEKGRQLLEEAEPLLLETEESLKEIYTLVFKAAKDIYRLMKEIQ